MYSYQDITNSIIKIVETTPSFKVNYLSRKKVYRIKYKTNGHYMSGWECFNQVKFLYETMNLQKINWDYFIYTIYNNHIEIPNAYKIV